MTAPSLVCIDFGTSSIRAAIRHRAGEDPSAIALGDALGSSIDRASIPSACFVSADRKWISFGENALRDGLTTQDAALFETSPKRWMSEAEYSELDAEAAPGVGVSRRQLLAGLLAQAGFALSIALDVKPRGLRRTKLRIAHPAWTGNGSRGRRIALYEMLSDALDVAGETNDRIRPEDLRRLAPGGAPAIEYDVDVVEPVAAALYVYGKRPESRDICLVVDVGAGTTDMAAFVGFNPGDDVTRKFIFATDAHSVPRAGDVIDAAVVDLLGRKARLPASGPDMTDLIRRKRQLKEDLFKTGQALFSGQKLTLEELESSDEIGKMADAITGALSTLLSDAKTRIKVFKETGARTNHMDVVFVGGGANIGFLHRAITSAIEKNTTLKMKIVPGMSQPRGLPASPERLAVCLGGTTRKTDWPETKMKEPEFWKGLPM